MDAFSLLKADHRKVEQLFSQLESASGQRKLTVFEQIRTELELHAHIEEKIFYPALEKPSETRDLTMEAYEEHAMVKKLLQQLGRARTADEEWQMKAKVLQTNVEHHVQEEENELFPKAEDALGEEEIEAIGERMEAEKEKKQGRTAAKGSKKSGGAKKSASKTTAGSKAAKRTRGTKKSSSEKSSRKSGSKSRSRKSAAKKR